MASASHLALIKHSWVELLVRIIERLPLQTVHL